MRRFARLYFLIFTGLFFLAGGFLSAQETEEPPDPPEVSDPAETIPPGLEELYFEKDLELSTLDELQIWCRSLGLDDQGGRGALMDSLRDYYAYSAVPSSEATAKGEGEGGLEIVIESADRTEYLTIEDRGEEIHLSGEVSLTVTDKTTDGAYQIRADKIFFSRLDDSLTALGNVEYIRSRGGGQGETFYGESMTFHIEGWKGVIFQGVSSQTDTVDGKEIEFFFTGREIDSSGFDLAVMKKGVITSGKWEDPEYSIRASKIWLLGPEEWGLANGVLYLGRVPLLYLPFYYNPGNELFFNPVFGYRSREGVTLQTTTYFLGQKAPVNNSFFSAGLNSESLYELERQGLYLFKGDKKESADKGYLKLMADSYSRLGGFAGLEGELYPGKSSNSLDIFMGLGFSRSIDSDNNIYFGEDDEYISNWNESHLGALDLPFRWGSSFSYSLKNFSLSLAYYTDPSFTEDFLSIRSEDFDLLNWMLSDEGTDEIQSSGELTSFSWDFNWNKNFTLEETSPFLKTINISRLNSSLEWESRRDSEAYTLDPYSPTADFFYPETLVLPDMGLSLSGVLWESGRGNDSTQGINSDEPWIIPEEDGIPRTESAPESSPENPGPDKGFRLEENRNSRSLPDNSVFSGSLGWNSSLTTLIQNDFDNDEWSTPEDVSLKLEEGKLSLTNRDSLDLKLGLYDGLISFTNGTDFKINHREYLSLSESEWSLDDSQLKDQYSYNSISWDNLASLKFMPITYYALEESYIKYDLGMVVYEKKFDSMDGRNPVYEEYWLSGDEETLTKSELETKVYYEPLTQLNLTNKFTTDIYTDERDKTSTVYNGVNLNIWKWSNSLNQTCKRSDEKWEALPLNYQGKLALSPLTLSEQFSYDLEESRFDSNKASLSLWGLNAALNSSYTTHDTWDNDNYTWVTGEQAFLLSSFNLGYSNTIDIGPYWKNRTNHKISLNTNWNQNLIRINSSTLSFTFGFETSIHEFLDLNLSVQSSNDKMYIYIPAYRDKLGITREYPIWEDLLKSFNFFDTRDRYESYFNLSSLKLDLVHDLGNWDFTLNYTGTPSLTDNVYQWESEFSFLLKWDPIPTINMDIRKDDEENWDITAGETGS